MISVYVHIPFCMAKCSYCDFFSVPVGKRSTQLEKYHEVLIKQFKEEVERLQLADRGVNSIYIGGGTPSLLPAHCYEKLMWEIATTFVMQSDVEVTCEVNPATVDKKWFKRMVEAGVNRFSIGVQSFQDAKLKRLGRQHDAKDAQRVIAEAQDSGAHSINVDMMYGLPGQRLSDVESDLKLAMTFQPEHISAYQLTLEPGTELAEMIKKGKVSLPSDDDVLKQLRIVRRMLASGGWDPYEISNFAKPHFPCRHNMHYWRYGEYIGLGAGATSFIVARDDGLRRPKYAMRWTTTRDVAAYMKGTFAKEAVENIGRRTAMGEYCFLGLRMDEGISLGAFEQRFGVGFTKAFPGARTGLEKSGLANVTGDRLTLTQQGVELSNQVFQMFVE